MAQGFRGSSQLGSGPPDAEEGEARAEGCLETYRQPRLAGAQRQRTDPGFRTGGFMSESEDDGYGRYRYYGSSDGEIFQQLREAREESRRSSQPRLGGGLISGILLGLLLHSCSAQA